MTNNMQAFISLNKKHHIIKASRVTPKGKRVITVKELENSNIEYRFKDGSILILTCDDLASAPDNLAGLDL